MPNPETKNVAFLAHSQAHVVEDRSSLTAKIAKTPSSQTAKPLNPEAQIP